MSGVQRSIARKVAEEEAAKAESWEGVVPAMMTMFNSQRGEKAGAWLATLPVDQFTKIINTEFTVAMQLRLLYTIPTKPLRTAHCVIIG
jgi:hypothetical protein